MKILLSSYRFAPSVGGIETVSEILAAEFVRAGHEVVVTTETTEMPGSSHGGGDDVGYRIARNPSWRELLGLVRWCDVVFHNNVSLRGAWPLLLVRRPWVVAHHVWIRRGSGEVALTDRLKQLVLRGANRSLAGSAALSASMSVRSQVVGTPYRSDRFYLQPQIVRDRELIFVGRLVSDKGGAVLLRALGRLKERGKLPRLTIVGDGPEKAELKRIAIERGLHVDFAGIVIGDDYATLLNRHRIMVIPSLWEEPFGVVALEGIACGCVAIGTRGGGLPEAIGKAGLIVPRGDDLALADAIEKLLTNDPLVAELRGHAADHLRSYQPAAIARAHLQVFAEVCR